MSERITLVGAGLVGSLLAIYLTRRGHRVTVYERRPDMRTNRISAGRSINLALSDRGWRGLERVGVDAEVRKIGIPMKGRAIHNLDGSHAFQAYGNEHQANYSVSRGGLNCLLMDLAEKEGVEIRFNEQCVAVDLQTVTSTLKNTQSGKESRVSSDHVMGTDGGFSSVRLAMQLATDRFTYSQTYLDHGYKELTITPSADGFALDPNVLHIWPRGQFMLIALPNLDKTFTCTLFFPFEGEYSFATINSREKVRSFFNKMFPNAIPLMPSLEEDYMNNPTSSLATFRCYPWHYQDKLLLVGDAAHGIVPFFGQGMNCGFEDCVVLDKLMERKGTDWSGIFEEYSRSRKPDADAIAHLAIENYKEMRDKVADPVFLLQKKIEARFSEKYPEKWTPLYAMVTYRTDLRYSEALEKGNFQEAIMKKVMGLPGIREKWDSEEVEQMILAELN